MGGTGGGSGGGSGGGGGTTGRVAANPVGLDEKPGYVDMYILPGQGRAPGSIWANFHIFRLIDFATGNAAELDLPNDMKVQLDQFNIQNRGFSTEPSGAVGPYPNSKSYDTLDIVFGDYVPGGSVQGFQLEDDFGGISNLTANPSQETMIGEIEATAYRGRTTSFQLYINDSMVVQDGGGSAHLDVPAFLAANRNPATNKVRAFLADQLRFDISALPQAKRPVMPAGQTQFLPEESTARAVFLNGDCYAIGDLNPRGVNGSNGLFLYLPPNGGANFFEGFYRPQDPTTLLKTYELKQADPSVIGQIRLISALKGTYKNFNEAFTNIHTTEFVLLPKTGDGAKQDIVVVTWNGSSITDMWFGTADFGGAAGSSPTFRIYPIKNLYPASTANEIRGTLPVNALEGRAGATVTNNGPSSKWWQNVRYGQFKFNTTAPTGLPQSGDFVVYRAP